MFPRLYDAGSLYFRQMQKTNHLPIIAALGVILLGGATAYRQHVLALRREAARASVAPAVSQPVPASSPPPLSAAAQAQETALLAGVTAHPDSLPLRWNLVAFYGQTGQTQKAKAQLDDIDRRNPQDEADRMALGNTRLLLHENRAAEADYRRVIALRPQSAPAWRGLATVLFRRHRYFEARQAAQKAVNLDPKNTGGHLILASSALEYALQFPEAESRSSDFALAQSEYKRVINVVPNNAHLYYELGRASFGLEQANEAVQAFSRSLQLDPQQDIYWDAAQAYIKNNDRATAQKLMEEGLRRYPNDAYLHEIYGKTVQTSSAPDADARALGEFQKAVQIEPDNPSFQSDLGTAYLRTGSMTAAQTAFETAVRLDPNRPFDWQQLAGIYTRQGNPSHA